MKSYKSNTLKYSPNIAPRKLRFSCPETIEKYWHGGSCFQTYHFNALALFLPILEKLVVLSIKKALKDNLSAKLKSEVESLVAQEAIHGAEFSRFNKKLFLQHYHNMQPSQYSLGFFRLIAYLLNKISSTFHYSLSAAGEHFTAISADLFLRSPKWFEGVPAPLSAIWRWHCIEEIEHKTVAYDVFQAKNGRYFIRILGMLLMTVVFILMYVKPIWQMMKEDKNHKKISFYLQAFQYYWGKNGLGRALFKPYLQYFKPSFHPSQQDNQVLIASWKDYFKTASNQEMVVALEKVKSPERLF